MPLLARQHGRIADENTNTDERGTVTSAHLVLRVPSDRFDRTMTELAGVATLRSSTRKGEDVTTQVIDTEARIKAQQAGVRRLRDLVSRAANLPALLAVERELTARQGRARVAPAAACLPGRPDQPGDDHRRHRPSRQDRPRLP